MGVENEPRVPAGSPEGGQWTAGGLPSQRLSDMVKESGRAMGEARDEKGHDSAVRVLTATKEQAISEGQTKIASDLDKHIAEHQKSLNWYRQNRR